MKCQILFFCGGNISIYCLLKILPGVISTKKTSAEADSEEVRDFSGSSLQ